MLDYCTSAMFGGETKTTFVMILFSAAIALFMSWVLIDAVNNKIKKQRTMHEEPIKKESNYFLMISLVLGAIIISSAWMYSAKIGAQSSDRTSASVISTSPSAQAPSVPRPSGSCGI